VPNIFEEFYRYMTSSRLVNSYEVWKTFLPQPPSSFDMSSVCNSTRRDNPEVFNLPQHCFENLKSCVVASLEDCCGDEIRGWMESHASGQPQTVRWAWLQSVLIFTVSAYENSSLC